MAQRETLNFDNTTAAVRSVFVIVDTAQALAAAETVDLSFTIGAIPAALPGETCANAVAVTAPATLTTETTVGYVNDIATATTMGNGCSSFSNGGPDKIYSVTIPAGQLLTAAVTNVGAAYDTIVYIVAGPTCTATVATCLGSGTDMPGAGGSETATYRNMGAAPQQVFIVVDFYSATAMPNTGTYSLGVTVTP